MERNERAPISAPAELVWHDDHPGVSAYLDRCQVFTPDIWIQRFWAIVQTKRSSIRKVVEFGAGDGRFSRGGRFGSYVGYEVDTKISPRVDIPKNARIRREDAFSTQIRDADLCIGNPPYVRNQDLPSGWRKTVRSNLEKRTGVAISGLANAWQYFMFLACDSTKSDGLVAQIIPYEWVSRASAKALRDHIKAQGWSVDVYRLPDTIFGRVLTTSSFTIIDKAGDGKWHYYDYDESEITHFRKSKTASLSSHKVAEYRRDSERAIAAKRGLSPGTQKVFVLTEAERVRYGLKVERDVVPAVTTLRHISESIAALTDAIFKRCFVDAGARCWLIRSDRAPSRDLQLYLDSIQLADRSTATCLHRETWWKFMMPQVPKALISMGFRTSSPKCLMNDIGAHAVGGVAGIYCKSRVQADRARKIIREFNFQGRMVPYSTGLLKLEINQLNGILDDEMRSVA